ncbi:LLM class flavin-dependent oxidoreductase [Cellulomonas alba]|uniref:LLM class flavin-dependent oxidoreductase n=1 Tax=Cellulomonas alba TaxID=3053467 RepID=A0ABT7SEI8_9CELL|nr:LLM class flavin-dependent oxidoreductase [Cellulomonas alba]MDM7854586.1 LLM class flavin-dependent oxidoreductase [Cellulomonas alba]
MVAVGLVILPQERWATGRRRWQQAEEWGFDHAWTYDHLSWRSLVEEPWFATVPLLAAAAAVTSRIRLGTFVASPNFRHPVPFAKDVMGLDDVSGGRLLLGLGSGGEGFDASVLGPAVSRGERTRRFEEFVALLDELLTSPVTTRTGEFWAAHEARMVPGTIATPRPPFVVAASGPRAMAVAARHGQGWVTYGPSFGGDDTAAAGTAEDRWWTALERESAAVDAALADAGRARDGIRRYLSYDGPDRFALDSVDRAVDVVHRAAAAGFTDVVLHWPREAGIYAGDERVLEQLAARLPELHALTPAAR